MSEITKLRDYKVVKDNQLIQNVTRRKSTLTVLEQKAIGYILSLIKPPDNATSQPIYEYTFDIRHFCRVCGIDYNNGKNYQNIKNVLCKLASNGFWIEVTGDKEIYFQWIVTPEINKGSGKITIEIPKKIMPYLYGLQEKFTEYELFQILALKSAHSIALYEMMKSYAYQKKVILDITEIKYFLGIEKKYAEYKAFRRKIIEPAIEEINEFTDLEVNWCPIRDGRFYTKIEFRIKFKKGVSSYISYKKIVDRLESKEYV